MQTTASVFVDIYDSLRVKSTSTTQPQQQQQQQQQQSDNTDDKTNPASSAAIDMALARFDKAFARATTVRDLLKWCDRCATHAAVASLTAASSVSRGMQDDARELVFREAMDCFGGGVSEVMIIYKGFTLKTNIILFFL